MRSGLEAYVDWSRYPITLGDVELPPSARLRVHHTNLSTAPLELVTLADIPQNMVSELLNDARGYIIMDQDETRNATRRIIGPAVVLTSPAQSSRSKRMQMLTHTRILRLVCAL